MGRNLYKFTKIFDDVIKMRQLKKVEGFQGFGLNISKKVNLIFTKLLSFFRQSYIEVFEIKRLKIGHSLLPW